MRPAVNLGRITDLAQGRGHLGKHPLAGRVPGKIARFFRIIFEIEQLILKADIVDQLVAPLAKHERPAHRANRMVFAEHHTVGRGIAGGNLHQRHAHHGRIGGQTEMRRNAGRKVQKRDRRIADARRQRRIRHQHRNRH